MPRTASDSTVFNAIACDTRRVLLNALALGEASVGEIVDQLHVSQPAVSQHLAILKEVGLVEERAEGRRRVYRLRTEPLEEVTQWIATCRALWETKLDALGAVLDGMDDETTIEPGPKRPKRKRP